MIIFPFTSIPRKPYGHTITDLLRSPHTDYFYLEGIDGE